MNNTKNFQNTADQGREKQSAKAYLRFLESKGANTRMLYLRSRFLDDFTVNLVDQAQTRKAYAVALRTTLKNIKVENKQLAIHTSREFFPFWMNDIKGIAKFESAYGFTVENTQWQPQVDSLESISNRIDQERFTAKERDSLMSYAEKLSRSGQHQNKIEKRTKLAKVMLICLREAPSNNHMVYRAAVDTMLPLFKTSEVKQSYLDVAREFFHVWKDRHAAL